MSLTGCFTGYLRTIRDSGKAFSPAIRITDTDGTGKLHTLPRPIGKWMWYCRTSSVPTSQPHRGHYKLIEARMGQQIRNNATGLTTDSMLTLDCDMRLATRWGDRYCPSFMVGKTAIYTASARTQLAGYHITAVYIFTYTIFFFFGWIIDYYHTLPMAVWISRRTHICKSSRKSWTCKTRKEAKIWRYKNLNSLNQ